MKKWDANTGAKETVSVPWTDENAGDFWRTEKQGSSMTERIVLILLVIATLAIFLLGILLISEKAKADPPPGVDLQSPLHLWFNALREPDDPKQDCCGYHHDCWETDAWLQNGHWVAMYHPNHQDDQGVRLVTVPDGVVNDLDHTPQGYNMAVKAVLCAANDVYLQDPTIYCFVPPATGY
ncbi:MAG: hypothetical protein KGJ90_02050 [Patescibacteria group bacterium]|nr:hypothetical protein [Patescibacteria group bacterium]